ncbi:MAG: transglutaminase family protein [Chloroflexi bacterium]|nr:transglutaminase family protein [Chloroflexota bacterium]
MHRGAVGGAGREAGERPALIGRRGHHHPARRAHDHLHIPTARPARRAPHDVRPLGSHDLRLVGATLDLSPAASIRWVHDVFGNSIAIATFDEPTTELRAVSRVQLEHFASIGPEFVVAPHARMFPFSYSMDERADLGRMIEPHYDDPDHDLLEWARVFLRSEGETETHALLASMTEAIRRDFEYMHRAEEGTQTPAETLKLRSGTCRDFALLMMEAVRQLGLGARFVSGYLYDQALVGAAAPLVGGGETHAWLHVYLPGAGWVAYDPTNGRVGARNLLRVAVARDASQAIPMSGTGKEVVPSGVEV